MAQELLHPVGDGGGQLSLVLARGGNGGYLLSFNGTPGFSYRLQRATEITGPWNNLDTQTAPASGLVEYHDTNPPNTQAFYRAVQP